MEAVLGEGDPPAEEGGDEKGGFFQARLQKKFQPVEGELDVAMEVAVIDDVFVELELLKEEVIGVLGVVVGDDPVFYFGILAEDGRIRDGRMAPADSPLVFEGGVLGLMDEDVAAGEEIDDRAVGFDEGVVFAYCIGVAMVAEEELVIGGVAKGLAADVDFEAEGGARMEGIGAVDGDVANGDGMAIA